MAGSVLALLLARFVPRAKVTLFDKLPVQAAERPSFDGRSTAIAPTTVGCFQQLGLWPLLASAATPIQKIHVSDQGHAGLGVFDGQDNAGEPLGYVVENLGLGKVLQAAVAKAPNIVTEQAHVNTLRVLAEGAELHWQGEAEAQQGVFGLVVVADGAESPLRAQLGIAVTRVDYEQYALVANVRHQLPHNLQAYERFTRRGPVALLPRGGRANGCESGLVWTCPKAEYEALRVMPEAERLAKLQREFGFRLGHFSAMSTPDFYPLALVVAQEQVRSRVVLMGNAAHFLHPVAGQGFNLTVRDSLRLVEVLTEAVKAEQPMGALPVLQRYLQRQAVDQRNTIGLSHGFNRIFTQAPLPMQLLRTMGMLALELNPVLRMQFIQLLAGRGQPQALLG